MLTHRFAARAVVLAMLMALPLATRAAARTGPVEVDLADRLLVAARDAAVRHPGTQAAQWQSQAAAHDLAAVERRRLPRPSVALTTSQGTTSTEARLTQTLHDWGGTQARIDAAGALVSAAGQGVREHERGVALEVIEAWRAWAASGVRARSQAVGLVRLVDYEQRAQRRGQAGFGSDADVELVRSRVVQARSDEASALATQAAAAARLRGLGVSSPPLMEAGPRSADGAGGDRPTGSPVDGRAAAVAAPPDAARLAGRTQAPACGSFRPACRLPAHPGRAGCCHRRPDARPIRPRPWLGRRSGRWRPPGWPAWPEIDRRCRSASARRGPCGHRWGCLACASRRRCRARIRPNFGSRGLGRRRRHRAIWGPSSLARRGRCSGS